MTTKTAEAVTSVKKTENEQLLQQTVEQLKNFKWVDLTHSFGPESPRFPAFAKPKFNTISTHADGFFSLRSTPSQVSLGLIWIHRFTLMLTKTLM